MGRLEVFSAIEGSQVISIDLDGVLMMPFLGKVWFPFHSKRLRTPKILDPFENSLRSVIQLFRPVFEGSREVLKKWQKEGKILYLVTSRHKNIIPVTGSWLNKNNLTSLFAKLVFNSDRDVPSEFKVSAIKELNVDLHIDDDLITISALSKELPNKKFVYFSSGSGLGTSYEKGFGINVACVNSWRSFQDY